jgi:hypothetical protein
MKSSVIRGQIGSGVIREWEEDGRVTFWEKEKEREREREKSVVFTAYISRHSAHVRAEPRPPAAN